MLNTMTTMMLIGSNLNLSLHFSNKKLTIQGLNSSELLSTCLCHGYLDMYASLWTSWKLMCEGKTSLEANMKKKTR